jgi:membrane protein
VIGWVLLATMIFFSGLAFTVLENAMSVIFFHRVAERKRRFIVSAVLPYCYILSLGVGVLLVTLVSGSLQAMALHDIEFLGHSWSLGNVSGVLLYLLGFAGEVFVLTSIYLVMPVGRLKFTHALMGGVTAAVLWEITRHILTWYFATLSQVSVVYGSLTTAIIVLLSLEFAAILLLLGAQVIAEYERIATEPIEVAPQKLRTAKA